MNEKRQQVEPTVRIHITLFTALVILATGCVGPIGTDRVTTHQAYDATTANALDSSKPSNLSKRVLRRYDAETAFQKEPQKTLANLHQKATRDHRRDLMFALSELSFLEGDRISHSVKPWEPRPSRDFYLASAVYAYFYLFGDFPEPPPGRYDPQFRLACDLYNYSLGLALIEPKKTDAIAVIKNGERQLPFGTIAVTIDTNSFPLPLTQFDRFLVTSQFGIRGLSLRNSEPGLGTPLIATQPKSKEMPIARCVPVSAFLRIDGDLNDVDRGRAHASLELYSGFERPSVKVNDRTVPIEVDLTTHLAYSLNDQFIWKLGSQQFFSSEEKIKSGIYFSQPYRPGRIPVILIHGTFSSPIYWAEMMNTLAADDALREKYQFWYYLYNSGNPIPYSAAHFRNALTNTVQRLDPTGHDPALRQIVLIGHSQGGLLTKLAVTDTGDKLWRAYGNGPLDELKVSAEQREQIRRYIFFEALPEVTRVVFVATPHRGSYLAGSLARRLASYFLTLPGDLVRRGGEMTRLLPPQDKMDLPKELRKGAPTSLTSMSPKNPGLLALAALPQVSSVKAHSIIAVKGNVTVPLRTDPASLPQGGTSVPASLQNAGDGVVKYTSAHVTYADSELIVRSGHSCQSNPATIEEVRRILLEHLASLPRPATNH